MPDPKRLHSFLGRTQNWLQRSMDEGDEEATNYYEQLMERGGQVAERLMAQQTAPTMSVQAPVEAGPGSESQFNDQQRLGRVMQYNEPSGQQYRPDSMYQPQGLAINTQVPPQQTPQQQAPQSPAQLSTPLTPPIEGATPLYDLTELNKPSQKLTVDLSNELANPFAPKQTASQSFLSQFPRQASPGLKAAETEATGPSVSDTVSGLLQSFKPRQMTDVGNNSWIASPMTQADRLDEAKKMGAGYVKGTGDPEQNPKFVKEELVYTGITPPQPPFEGEPEEMPSRYERDPVFRKRIDMMGQVTKVAEDPFEKEFLKRVEREVGKKPSFFTFETLAMLLLMGAPRAYQNFQNQKQAYQTGRADVAKGMRGELATAKSQQFKADLDSMRRKLDEKQSFAVLLPKVVRDKQQPALQRARSISGQIQAIERQIPAPEPNDPRIVQLKAEMEAALLEAEQIAADMYKGISGATQ